MWNVRPAITGHSFFPQHLVAVRFCLLVSILALIQLASIIHAKIAFLRWLWRLVCEVNQDNLDRRRVRGRVPRSTNSKFTASIATRVMWNGMTRIVGSREQGEGQVLSLPPWNERLALCRFKIIAHFPDANADESAVVYVYLGQTLPVSTSFHIFWLFLFAIFLELAVVDDGLNLDCLLS